MTGTRQSSEARAYSTSTPREGLPCSWERCENRASRVVIADGHLDAFSCWSHAGRRLDELNWASRSASGGIVAEA